MNFDVTNIFNTLYQVNVSNHRNDGAYMLMWQIGCKCGCKNGEGGIE